MRIQHNIAAMNSYRNYNINTGALNKNLEKLSSGYKINRAGDDAAGLAISEKMRAQISGLKQAQNNVKDGISLVKTAEGALQEVQDMMNRMVTLATQSANGTYDNDVDRDNLQKEVEALATEINRIADASNFNGQKLLDGSLGGAKVASTTGKAGATGVGSASTVTLDFKDKTAAELLGGSIKVGDTTFKFVEKASASTTAGTEEIVIDSTMDDAAIAKAFAAKANAPQQAVTDGAATNAATYTAATISSGTVVTFTEKQDGNGDFSGSNNLKVEQKDVGLMLQIGDTADSYNQLKVSVGDMHTTALGIDTISVENQAAAAEAVEKIKDAINTVSGTRGDLGAIQNRLEHTTNNLAVMTENIQDAESTIRDTDIADEMTTYTKNNILLQSAQAMLAQANQMPQGVLQLLQ